MTGFYRNPLRWRTPSWFGWSISLVLNKGQYASCMNPHIGLIGPGRSFMLRFAPSPIWDGDFDRKRRQLYKVSRTKMFHIVRWGRVQFVRFPETRRGWTVTWLKPYRSLHWDRYEGFRLFKAPDHD